MRVSSSRTALKAVVQSLFATLPRFCIYKRDVLIARVVIHAK